MEQNTRSEAIIALGKRLISQLDVDDSRDVLSCWIANYIAELIEFSQSAAPEEKAEADERCMSAILRLWEHRRHLPDGSRPFDQIESILKTIEGLDPSETHPRYYSHFSQRARAKGDSPAPVERWLETAEGLDHTARMLIRFCLWQAANLAGSQSAEWLKLAEEAGLQEGPDVVMLRFFKDESNLLESQNERDRAKLEERLQRLEAFSLMADAVADEIRNQLASLKPSVAKPARKPRKTKH